MGDGHNKIAVLDPAASQIDEYSTTDTSVMKEVLTMEGPTHFPGAPAGQVYEWCISSAVVDPTTGSIFVNSEDGHLYRWKAGKWTQLTHGDWEVAQLAGVDEKKGKVYFLANKDGVLERHLYAIDLAHPGAPFTQFTYMVQPPVPLIAIGDVEASGSALIWRNVPPARVWTYRRPT